MKRFPRSEIDLHARTMYMCILDDTGNKVIHMNIAACDPVRFLQAIAPFREDLVVGVECIFCWYWLSDLCQREGIDFILGHALYMKSIHGVKTKNDRIDSLKIVRLIRGGNFPLGWKGAWNQWQAYRKCSSALGIFGSSCVISQKKQGN